MNKADRAIRHKIAVNKYKNEHTLAKLITTLIIVASVILVPIKISLIISVVMILYGIHLIQLIIERIKHPGVHYEPKVDEYE